MSPNGTTGACMADGRKMTLDTAHEGILWESRLDEFDTMLNVINDGNEYTVKVQDAGWQDEDGEGTVVAQGAHELLSEITPRHSPWELEVELDVEGNAIHGTLSDHDSPTGHPITILGPEPQ